MAYQGTFAIITAALISGAIVERMRFGPYLAFITLWALVVYAPGRALGVGRRLARRRWARSTSRAARSCTSTPASRRSSRALVLGPRKDYARQAFLPHNVPFTSARRGPALVRLVRLQRRQRARRERRRRRSRSSNTLLAPMATLVVWMLLDLAAHRKVDRGRRRDRHRRRPRRHHAGRRVRQPAERASRSAGSRRSRATSRSSGAPRTRLDDSLDVVAAHGVGGTVGALLTGVFAQKAWNAASTGCSSAIRRQLGIQAVAVLAALAYSARRARSCC